MNILDLCLMVFNSTQKASTAEEGPKKHGTCTLTLSAAVSSAAVHTQQGASSNTAQGK